MEQKIKTGLNEQLAWTKFNLSTKVRHIKPAGIGLRDFRISRW
jgi:hypothetical protein